MGRKRCIELTDDQQLTLREAIKNHPKHEFRRTCQALLWSHKKWAAKTIATELEVCPQTVSNWLTAWQEEGLSGLMRQKGQGRKPILSLTNTAHQQALSKAVDNHYQDAARIRTELEQVLGQSMSRDTVKRFLKKTIIPGIASAGQPNPNKTRLPMQTESSDGQSC